MSGSKPGESAKISDDREAVLSALGGIFTPEEVPPATLRRPLSATDLPTQFMCAVEENAASARKLQNESEIASAIAEYLRTQNLPLHAVCTPEWSHLAWDAVGIRAEFRAPEDSDMCGITGVSCAAADCGAMAVRADEQHRLKTSLLPPHHVAVVRKRDIVPSLRELFVTLAVPGLPGVMSLLCGPSRTADIEQTLTLGVHGPLAVHVLLVEEAV